MRRYITGLWTYGDAPGAQLHRSPLALRMVRTPPRLIISARALLGMLLLAGCFMLFVPWQQSSTGSGQIIAYAPVEREQRIEAPIDGRLMQWSVQEGQRVEEGELLARIADNDPEILNRLAAEQRALEEGLRTADASIGALERTIEAKRASRKMALEGMDAKIEMSVNKQRAQEQKRRGAEAEQATAELNLKRQGALEDKGLSSTRTLELAQLSDAKARAEVFSARAGVNEARSNLLAVKAERVKVESDYDGEIAKASSDLENKRSDRAKLSTELLKLETRLARQQAMTITAPRAGTVMRVIARQGNEYVKAGDVLAVMVPDTHARAVEVLVRGNDAPLIFPGRPVRLQFEGWPAVQFSGWPSVAVGTFPGIVSFVDASADAQGRFRVLVVPDPAQGGEASWPESTFLRQGARANAWVLLDTVSIGYEVWRQLNGFPPSIDPARMEESYGAGGKK
jgi:membrane fusion protein, adhesin transport system